jgi:hypothetical protein
VQGREGRNAGGGLRRWPRQIGRGAAALGLRRHPLGGSVALLDPELPAASEQHWGWSTGKDLRGGGASGSLALSIGLVSHVARLYLARMRPVRCVRVPRRAVAEEKSDLLAINRGKLAGEPLGWAARARIWDRSRLRTTYRCACGHSRGSDRYALTVPAVGEAVCRLESHARFVLPSLKLGCFAPILDCFAPILWPPHAKCQHRCSY